MNVTLHLVGIAGQGFATLADRLRSAAFDIGVSLEPAEATVLVSFMQPAEQAIAMARAFAVGSPVPQHGRLIANVWRQPALLDWDGSRQAATMSAFTRHAALAWARRGIRVNAISLAAETPHAHGSAEADVAETIFAFWRWTSMTGQVISLVAPPPVEAFLPRTT